MQAKDFITASGKPLTIPTATRLTVAQYERVQQQAKQEGVTVSALLQKWVTEKLTNTGGHYDHQA